MNGNRELQAKYCGKPGRWVLNGPEYGYYNVRIRGVSREDERHYPDMVRTAAGDLEGRIPVDDPGLIVYVEKEAIYKGIRVSVSSIFNGRYLVSGVYFPEAPKDLLIEQYQNRPSEFAGGVLVGDPSLCFIVGHDVMVKGHRVHVEDEQDGYFLVTGYGQMAGDTVFKDLVITAPGTFTGKISIGERDLVLVQD